MPDLIVDQNQESRGSLVALNSEVVQAPLASVQSKANDLWATLAEKDTSPVYQEAIAKTWKLLKQAITLLFALWVLLTALVIWIWGIGFLSGRQLRTWLEVKQPKPDKVLSAFLNFLVWPFEQAFEWAGEFVKKYLGWEIEFNQITSEPEPETPEVTPTESAQAKSVETTEPPSES